ncbi:putative GPI-anchored protein pfl2 isoform X2 [Scaptodrosophila lebanonensis]|uniref:GPI-anchored protein pfl2 isoform X2 n=1 Tax=Drosophila lebanonensis TaxID=7225 RepID=A0A6J2U0T0_DROLE|nr:putative GPI-anchored protein pfl2 isoform X2 [Scaptodrosophila lebanonensis]
MTFYWWSHWFWITWLGVHLMPNAITHVHTYPSQEITLELAKRQEFQEQQREIAAQAQLPTRLTTKLYQTTSSLAWSTATPPLSNVMDLTLKPAGEAAATPTYTSELLTDVDEVEGNESDEMMTTATAVDDGRIEDNEEDNEDIDELDTDADPDVQLSHNQYEFKRSANFAADAGATLPSEHLNNYTNFSSITSTNSSSINKNNTSGYSHDNKSGARNNTSQEEPTAAPSNISSSSSPITKATTAAAGEATSSSAAPHPIHTTSSVTSLPLSSTTTVLGGSGVAATPSTPKINTEWLPLAGRVADLDAEDGELQKVPFTLENANKEDELRRAENEHRSRKSKELSAEYKHINRYINFSSDSKSLLTRSASAAPNAAAYDADESNISSEALAIQRTYFLDAGAISAICFTVFGICCAVGTIGIVLYRRRYLNKPQALSEPDSSVYIDDSTMRDNSDEMYSLDNDSFLNSLEAMTIQNYWTDTVKHTKL